MAADSQTSTCGWACSKAPSLGTSHLAAKEGGGGERQPAPVDGRGQQRGGLGQPVEGFAQARAGQSAPHR
jgi:hypothetical protein